MTIDPKLRHIFKDPPRKMVVAVDGHSGAGKTTLLRRLAGQYPQILPVYIDDFMTTGKFRRARLARARDKMKVMELEWNNVKKIRQLIRAFRSRRGRYRMNLYNPRTDRYDRRKYFDLSKQVLVLEGIFLFHPKLYRDLFDVRVFLDIDLQTAERRRIRREKKRWGKRYVSEDRPDSFVALFKSAYAQYEKRYQPRTKADFVLTA